jgi:hypothetical protein
MVDGVIKTERGAPQPARSSLTDTLIPTSVSCGCFFITAWVCWIDWRLHGR